MNTFNSNTNYTKFEDENASLYMSVEDVEQIDNSTNVDATNVDATNVDATNVDATNVDATNVDATNVANADATNDDADNKFNASINRRINESRTFRSIDLQEPNNTQHDIWSPNFDNSWKLGQPKNKTYYDTDKMSDSIDETKDSLKKNLINLNDRKSKLNNIESISDMLDTNAAKFQSNSRKLKYEMYSKYAFHTICIVLLIIFIITLIVIIVKS
jgi:hypothetical protein